MTQFEMTTSTDSAGSGICSITPLRKCDVRDARLAGVLLGEREHLVGHVDAVGDARRPDALRREDHVDPSTGTEVEHGLALAQLRDGGRVAATERCEHRGLGELAALVGGVQRLAEVRRLGVATSAQHDPLPHPHPSVRSTTARADSA